MSIKSQWREYGWFRKFVTIEVRRQNFQMCYILNIYKYFSDLCWITEAKNVPVIKPLYPLLIYNICSTEWTCKWLKYFTIILVLQKTSVLINISKCNYLFQFASINAFCLFFGFIFAMSIACIIGQSLQDSVGTIFIRYNSEKKLKEVIFFILFCYYHIKYIKVYSHEFD